MAFRDISGKPSDSSKLKKNIYSLDNIATNSKTPHNLKHSSTGKRKLKECELGINCPYKDEYQHIMEYSHDESSSSKRQMSTKSGNRKQACELGENCPFINEHQHVLEFTHDCVDKLKPSILRGSGHRLGNSISARNNNTNSNKGFTPVDKTNSNEYNSLIRKRAIEGVTARTTETTPASSGGSMYKVMTQHDKQSEYECDDAYDQCVLDDVLRMSANESKWSSKRGAVGQGSTPKTREVIVIDDDDDQYIGKDTGKDIGIGRGKRGGDAALEGQEQGRRKRNGVVEREHGNTPLQMDVDVDVDESLEHLHLSGGEKECGCDGKDREWCPRGDNGNIYNATSHSNPLIDGKNGEEGTRVKIAFKVKRSAPHTSASCVLKSSFSMEAPLWVSGT